MSKPAVKPRGPNGRAVKFFQEVVVGYDADDCLPWPFARINTGYGHLTYEGKKWLAHRLACWVANGPPPTARHEAAHSCGNGRLGCCNPRHVRWKTHKANMEEAVEHGVMPKGEAKPTAKLTDDRVAALRALKGSASVKELAARFGVNVSTAYKAIRGDTWGHVT